MNFKTRRIRKEPKKPKRNLKVKLKQLSKPRTEKSSYKMPLFSAAAGIGLILVLVFGIYTVIKSLDFSAIVFSFGKTLQTDETGKTNILLVGMGGENHDGANLTDTIIVASIDYNNKLVPMLSIPRDFYIISDEYGNQRINSVYDTFLRQYGKKEGIYILRNIISEITGLEIQYYITVDFQSFVDIVDSVGGVDIYVENAIYDPYYPKGETIYFETFSIDEGQQHLDGETALKYARSRKTTSDFDRAKRQQQLLYAIRDKALSLNILTDAGKIKSLYDSLSSSINTNLSLAEIIELAKLSKDFNKEDVFPIVLNDDPTQCGGFVYTPAREYFGGASVLLPAGGSYDYIHGFIDLIFNNVKVVSLQEEVQVLNGTKTPNLAGVTMNMLLRNCINVVYYGNSTERPLEKSTIYYKPGPEGEKPGSLDLITTLLPLRTQEGIPPEYTGSEKRTNSSIVIELGDDYLSLKKDDPFNSLKFLVAPATATSADSGTDAAAADEAAADPDTQDSETTDADNTATIEDTAGGAAETAENTTDT